MSGHRTILARVVPIENGWSYGGISRRGGLPRSTVHNLATVDKLSRPPLPATPERLAKGLDLPVKSVWLAAAEAAGLEVWRESMHDPEISVMIASLSQLTPENALTCKR